MSLIKTIKSLFNEGTKTKVIGLLTIFILLWLVLYFIPQIFASLFNTILGNLILITISILVSLYDYRYGIILSILFIVLYRFAHLSRYTSSTKESFTWGPDSTQDFLKIQNTINRNTIFDTQVLQEQSSQEDLDYFLKYGMWPWSQKVQDLYKEAVSNNPYIRTSVKDSLNRARKIYNQEGILQILSMQTKEGQFLLNGVQIPNNSGNPDEDLPSGFGDFGYKSGLIGHLNKDVVKCKIQGRSTDNPSTLERITYTGKDGIFGQQTKKITEVDYNDLENTIPGFQFINGPCNPCVAFNSTPDYSCPFKLQVKNKQPFISSVWQYLWSINDNPLMSQPSFLKSYINPNEFPLLSELQTELNKETKYQNKTL